MRATRLNDISVPGQQEFGVVGYTHAGGIDRPLVVWKGMGTAAMPVPRTRRITRARNHRLTIALLLGLFGSVLVSGCEPFGRAQKSSAVAEDLTGQWEIEMVATSGKGRGARTRGVLTLRSDPLPLSQCSAEKDGLTCTTHTRGVHTLPTAPLLRQELSRDIVVALVSEDEVLMVIGACCDRGEVSAKGKWKNGRFEGRWSDTWLSGPAAEGRFSMWRPPSR